MSRDNLDTITQDILRECEEDWVALWRVISDIYRVYGENLSAEKLRALTLQVVSKLFASGKVEAGWPTAAGGWEPWRLSPEAVLARIEAEWDALGEEPSIGAEIVWFAIPMKRPHPK